LLVVSEIYKFGKNEKEKRKKEMKRKMIRAQQLFLQLFDGD
jgi:hypothetical protein